MSQRIHKHGAYGGNGQPLATHKVLLLLLTCLTTYGHVWALNGHSIDNMLSTRTPKSKEHGVALIQHTNRGFATSPRTCFLSLGCIHEPIIGYVVESSPIQQNCIQGQ